MEGVFFWKKKKLEEHDFNANILFWVERKAYGHIFTRTSHEHDDNIEEFIEDIG